MRDLCERPAGLRALCALSGQFSLSGSWSILLFVALDGFHVGGIGFSDNGKTALCFHSLLIRADIKQYKENRGKRNVRTLPTVNRDWKNRGHPEKADVDNAFFLRLIHRLHPIRSK